MSVETTNAVEKAKDANKNDAQVVEGKSSAVNMILWLIVAILLATAIGGNYFVSKTYSVLFESSLYTLLKAGAVILIIAIACGIGLFTNQGKALLLFAKESYIEVRRVVWPTGLEARRTTLIIGVVTVLVSLLLWFCDTIFMHIISGIVS